MTAVRKKKLKLLLPGTRPRNPLVAAAAQRKAGAHQASKAKARQKARQDIRQALKEQSGKHASRTQDKDSP